jgi:hypothetical protein
LADVESQQEEENMPRFLVVSDVARRLATRPRAISDLFYQRKLSDARCPIVGGRRLIPEDYLPVVEAVLRKHGLLGDQRQEAAPCR